MDAQLIVKSFIHKISRASTLLRQLSTQTTEQSQLFNVKLAKLDCRADKKLTEGDVTITSVETSLLLIKYSITPARQALLTVDMIKGWVKDAVPLERLALCASTAPPVPSPQKPSGATTPSRCPPTMQGLAKNGI